MEEIQGSTCVEDLSDEFESAPAPRPEDFKSTCSSPCSSLIGSCDYEYNPDDFPKLNEIEEIQSPSFFWQASSSVSLNQGSGRSSPSRHNGTLPKKLPANVQMKMEHLTVLLSLSEIDSEDTFDNSESIKVISEAQQTIDKVYGNALTLKQDWKTLVAELEAAVVNISGLLQPMKKALAKPIQLAELVAKTAGEFQVWHSWHKVCQKLKSKAERLARLLWLAARGDLYVRPMLSIIACVEETLFRAATLMNKSQSYIARGLFTIIPAIFVKKILVEIDNRISDVCWFLRICKSSSLRLAEEEVDEVNLGPPIAVAKLLNSYAQGKAFVHDNKKNGKIIMAEGVFERLLKLVKEGGPDLDIKESAIKALGFLCEYTNPEIWVPYREACSILVSVLEYGSVNLQASAAWALSQLARSSLTYHFNNMALINLKGAVAPLVECLTHRSEIAMKPANYHDPFDFLNAMAIRTLLVLVDPESGPISNSMFRTILREGNRSKLMLVFSMFLERGSQQVQNNTAELLLEIACNMKPGVEFKFEYLGMEFKMAFEDIDQEDTTLIDQLLRIIRRADDNKLSTLCIEVLGWLSAICKKTEVIRPLIRLLGSTEADIVRHAVIALTKFAHEPFARVIAEEGAWHIAQLVYQGYHVHKQPALLLACYIVEQVPDNHELNTLIDWANKNIIISPTDQSKTSN